MSGRYALFPIPSELLKESRKICILSTDTAQKLRDALRVGLPMHDHGKTIQDLRDAVAHY